MTLPLYDIVADGDCWQVCLVFRDDRLPIPGKRFSSYEVAQLTVKLMEREDYALWQLSSLLPPNAEYDDFGNLIKKKGTTR